MSNFDAAVATVATDTTVTSVTAITAVTTIATVTTIAAVAAVDVVLPDQAVAEPSEVGGDPVRQLVVEADGVIRLGAQQVGGPDQLGRHRAQVAGKLLSVRPGMDNERARQAGTTSALDPCFSVAVLRVFDVLDVSSECSRTLPGLLPEELVVAQVVSHVRHAHRVKDGLGGLVAVGRGVGDHHRNSGRSFLEGLIVHAQNYNEMIATTFHWEKKLL